jgi:hypothetical protein
VSAAGHPQKVEKVRRHLAGLGSLVDRRASREAETYVRELLAPLLVDEEPLGELIR